MTYIYRKSEEDQKEAHQKAKQIMAICEQLHITLDPIDWQHSGMRAWVMVNRLKISDLLDLSQLDADSILRRFRIKLIEQAALDAVHAQPGLKASMWSPVEVVQPQEFLCLWIVTLETDERIAIAEYIKNEQRVYERFEFDAGDVNALARLFGPMHTGEYKRGDLITINEHDRRSTGEVVYVLPLSKAFASTRYQAKGHRAGGGKVYTSENSSRYIVDCHDGFPHIVNQWQIVSEAPQNDL